MGEPRSDMRVRRPVVYVSTSEGLITEWQAYDGETGETLHPDELPVFVVQIDWDDVAREDDPNEEYSATNYVRRVLATGELPARIQRDIELSLEHARRFDDLD